MFLFYPYCLDAFVDYYIYCMVFSFRVTRCPVDPLFVFFSWLRVVLTPVLP